MRFLYNLLFVAGFILSAPFYFLKMRRRSRHWRHGFGQRFGRYNAKLKQALTNRHVVWIHAVSVGEVNICTQLIRALEPRVPNIKLVVSTTTSTGMEQLREKLPAHIEKLYYPIDLRSVVRRSLNVIRPKAFVLVEAEIWPNFLWRARDQRIPVFLVNARLSERSYRGYKRFGFLFRPLFRNFAGVGCQNEADGERLLALGVRPEKLQIIGNLKFDAAQLADRVTPDVGGLLRQIGVTEEAPILLGGSTHAGEEAVLADVYLRLRQRFPTLFLLLVPRHFERGKEVGRLLESRGISYVYRSELASTSRQFHERPDCLIVNTTGELRRFYEHATIVFIGKSLTAEGGQNPIEPGALGKAIVFGPNMQNFSTIAEAFVKSNGAMQVADATQLESVVAELLANPQRREVLGANAVHVVRQNLGAIERTVAMVVERLTRTDTYVAPQPEVNIAADDSPKPQNPSGRNFSRGEV
jgi:3-deoxy-D-manno-octulosonic-acid transferase